MSIYTVDASIKNTRIASFEEHGLQGCSPSTVTACGIHVMPAGIRPNTIAAILNDIQNYGVAQVTQKALRNSLPQVNVLKFYTEIPVSQPLTMLNVKGFNDRDELKAHGFEEESNLNFPGEFMISGNITMDGLKKVWTYGPDPYGASPAGNVNLAGLYTFFLSWKAVALFQHVIGGRFEERPGFLTFVEAESKTLTQKDGTAPTISMHNVEVDMIQSARDATEMEEDNLISVNAYPLVSPIRSCCTRNAFVNPLSYKATSSGFLFPYFADMLIPDSDFMAGVFFRNFSNCIGDSPEAVAKVLAILRKGFKSLKASRQGRELQHIMFGVQSAIDSGAMLRVLVDKRAYKGFVLLGDIRVLVRNSLQDPSTKEQLTDLVASLDSHSRSIVRLTEIVSQLGMKVGGKLARWDENRASASSRYLADQLHARSIKGTEFEEEVKRLVKGLRYGDEFWSIDEGNTVKIFEHLLTGSIDDSAPFYLGGEIWNSDSLYVRILSVFGDRAPTISIRTGSKSLTIAKPGEEDPLLAGGKDRRLLYLPIYKSGLVDAASMWESVQRTHSFRYIPSKQKGPGKLFDRKADVGHIAGDKFLVFYEKLRTFAYAREGGKRAREETVEQIITAGERMAKRKTAIDEEASFL